MARCERADLIFVQNRNRSGSCFGTQPTFGGKFGGWEGGLNWSRETKYGCSRYGI